MGTMHRLALFMTTAVLVACGDDGPSAERLNNFPTTGGIVTKGTGGSATGGEATGGDATGGTTTGGTSTGGDATGGTDGTGGNATATEGPTVKLLSPAATTDPESDEVITSRTLKVQCEVGATEDGTVDESSVRIYHVSNEAPETLTEGVVDKQSGSIFEAVFNLAELPNGVIEFHCEASDTASPANVTNEAVLGLLDLGANIGFDAPIDAQILDLKRPVAVSFFVEPYPLTEDDSGAAVAPDQISLTVPGALEPISFSVGSEDGEYTASIDFDDRALFDAAPSTAEIVLKATNSRAAGPVTRTARINIALDGAGPLIEFVTPQNRATVRGEVVFRLAVSDPSGVAADKIVGTIPDAINGDHELTDWKLVDGNYVYRFDTNALDNDTAQADVNVTVEDTVGNKRTASLTLQLDNRPPLISLDPPDITEYDRTTVGIKCSWPFDPVGSAAANDLDIVSDGRPLLRALAWDQTNGAGQQTRVYSRTNPDTVTIYARRADGLPLVINAAANAAQTSGNGADCDEINSADLGAMPAPVQQSLVPLTPKGTAEYHPFDPYPPADPDNPVLYAEPNPGLCTSAPANTTAVPYCREGDMYRITTEHPIVGKVAGIYALNASNKASDPFECGSAWHLTTSLGSGWVCVAVRAEDNVGNVGVSRPLRLWIPGNGAPATPDTPAPSCTDGCNLPGELGTGYYFEKQ